MLASFDEAEDAVQETFLRAWRNREQLRRRARCSGRGSTASRRTSASTCSGASSRRLPTLHSFAEVPWLQPYPDRLLDEVAPSDEQPDAVVVERETIELAFLAALQVLPPRQRAALIVRDVLGWPATETASLLETSVAAANSALQRARATMQEHLPARRADWSAGEPSAEERALLERFIDAHERCDAAAAVAIAAQDIRITMPPDLLLLRRARPRSRRSSSARSARTATATGGSCRRGPTGCRPPRATCAGRATPSSGRSSSTSCASRTARIAEITTFGAGLFPAFGLPPTL